MTNNINLVRDPMDEKKQLSFLFDKTVRNLEQIIRIANLFSLQCSVRPTIFTRSVNLNQLTTSTTDQESLDDGIVKKTIQRVA